MRIFDTENVNKEASSYMEQNMPSLIHYAMTKGIQEATAHDLVTDVYMSIRKKEENGEGYTVGGSQHVSVITLPQYVRAMIKKYSLNKKYHSNTGVEISVDPMMQDADDDVVMSKAQKEYMYASSTDYDELSAIDESLFDMRDEIDYVINFTDEFNVRVVIENWSAIARGKVNKAILKPLMDIIKNNDEFAESFKRVVEYSLSNQKSFNAIMATM